MFCQNAVALKKMPLVLQKKLHNIVESQLRCIFMPPPSPPPLFCSGYSFMNTVEYFFLPLIFQFYFFIDFAHIKKSHYGLETILKKFPQRLSNMEKCKYFIAVCVL